VVLASLIVLLKNPGADYPRLCARLREQRASFSHEVIFVDSGSTDGTRSLGAGQADTRWLSVPRGEFGHGKTRNLAANMAKGRYLLFLTQDALPVDNSWLSAHVDFLEAHPGIDGAFGLQVPYPDAPLWVRRPVSDHFGSFMGAHWTVARGQLPGGRFSGPETARFHFFSNVNSCIRTSSWRRLPFRDVEFGEDQAWARDVVESGGTIAFNERAAVFHSHDYSPLNALRRGVDEGRSLRELFGYRMTDSVLDVLRQTRARVRRNDAVAVVEGCRRARRMMIAVRGGAVEFGSLFGTWLGSRADDHVLSTLARRCSLHGRRIRQ
jgi:rhamnosyltransferase